MRDLADAEEFVEPDVGQQVQAAVEEGEEADHAAEFDQPVCARQLPERRNSQRDEDKDERQHARRARRKLDGVCAEMMKVAVPRKERERHDAVDEDEQAREFNVVSFHCRSKSWRASPNLNKAARPVRRSR
jgi:hypothetical protein